jgi:hypothetical protein
MSTELQPCPYKSLPTPSYWRRSVAGVPTRELDPVVATKFNISKIDKVATAGSCFAQHIARYMANSGFNYHVAEPGHVLIPLETRKQYNYGTFSARYANIYTTRQLLQLVQRALGNFVPEEPVWIDEGKFIDPFRPHIQPNGFATLTEFIADRATHLRAVREMLQTMDVFVFTLGLTETWRSRIDGAVFPVCPGCGAGSFDADRYEFINLGIDEVVADLREALRLMRQVNPKLRVVLTVSPVPLIATYEPTHVLQATTYSKSVLRVAADQVAKGDDSVDYFPSYEIISGAYNRGSYFGEDLREVVEAGVRHVMGVFLRHYIGVELEGGDGSRTADQTSAPHNLNDMAASVICDEEYLEQ